MSVYVYVYVYVNFAGRAATDSCSCRVFLETSHEHKTGGISVPQWGWWQRWS